MAGGFQENRFKRERRKFTQSDYTRVYNMSKLRMPMDQMAAALGLHKEWFSQLTKNDDEMQAAIDRGRMASSKVMRKTLAERALGTPEREVETIVEVTDRRGRKRKKKVKTKVPPIPGDNRMLEFFLRSQEGFRTTERLEVTGADGVPVGEMNDDQAEQALERIMNRMKGKTDGEPSV